MRLTLKEQAECGMFCPGWQKWHGMLCPGWQKMAWDVLSRDVLSGSLPNDINIDHCRKQEASSGLARMQY